MLSPEKNIHYSHVLSNMCTDDLNTYFKSVVHNMNTVLTHLTLRRYCPDLKGYTLEEELHKLLPSLCDQLDKAEEDKQSLEKDIKFIYSKLNSVLDKKED